MVLCVSDLAVTCITDMLFSVCQKTHFFGDVDKIGAVNCYN